MENIMINKIYSVSVGKTIYPEAEVLSFYKDKVRIKVIKGCKNTKVGSELYVHKSQILPRIEVNESKQLSLFELL
ncbi:MAG: hypothetical protein N4A40_13015 [Tissierellales bacterium]|jgi:hypothetical protein|nr:hypothetical protein [Tissierellales bacterium]